MLGARAVTGAAEPIAWGGMDRQTDSAEGEGLAPASWHPYISRLIGTRGVTLLRG